jgi:hypothetical protein
MNNQMADVTQADKVFHCVAPAVRCAHHTMNVPRVMLANEALPIIPRKHQPPQAMSGFTFFLRFFHALPLQFSVALQPFSSPALFSLPRRNTRVKGL